MKPSELVSDQYSNRAKKKNSTRKRFPDHLRQTYLAIIKK